MFTKHKKIGEAKAEAYKKVTDWDAVWNAVILVVLGIGLIGYLASDKPDDGSAAKPGAGYSTTR